MRTLKCFIMLLLVASMSQAYAAREFVPSIGLSGEETKTTYALSPILEVKVEYGKFPGRYPSEVMDRYYPETKPERLDDGWFPDMSRKDMDEIAAYTKWLKRSLLNQNSREIGNVGSVYQVTGQFASVPEGVSLIVHAGLTRLQGVERVFMTLGEGPPYRPCIYLANVGWVGVFGPDEVIPGPKKLTCIVIDHSNTKKGRILWIDLFKRGGLGKQFGPLQFHVTEAADQFHRPFNVRDIDPYVLATGYCRGVIPAQTVIATPNPVTTTVPGQHDEDEQSSHDSQVAPQTESKGTRQGNNLGYPALQDVLIELVDEVGNPIQEPTEVEVASWDEKRLPIIEKRSMRGSYRIRMPRGDRYWAHVEDPAFHLAELAGDSKPVEVDSHLVIMRSPSARDEEVVFRFQKQLLAPKEAPVLQPYPRSMPRRRGQGIARSVNVSVSPRLLGRQALPLNWVVNGKKTNQVVVLKPGRTNVTQRFNTPHVSVIPVHKEQRKSWRVAVEDRGGSRIIRLEPITLTLRGKR